MEKVIAASNILWALIIKKLDINIFEKIICFDLISGNDDPIQEYHLLKIINCKGYLWIEKSKESYEDYDFKKSSYYEITSISFRNIEVKSEDEWLKQYNIEYNIAIEIWESVLLVKAEGIEIDDILYKI